MLVARKVHIAKSVVKAFHVCLNSFTLAAWNNIDYLLCDRMLVQKSRRDSKRSAKWLPKLEWLCFRG